MARSSAPLFVSPLDPSSIIPFRAGDVRRRSWRDTFAAGAAQAAVSLVLNLAVMTALVHLAFPRVLGKAEPQTITVDLVPEPLKAVAGSGASSSSAPAKTSTPAEPAGDSHKPAPLAEAAKPPPPPEAPPPEAEKPGPPAESAKPDVSAEVQTPKIAEPAPAPAPIDGDRNPSPRLVAAPDAPSPAETQGDKPVATNAEAKPADSPRATEQPPPPAPTALATPGVAPDTVPQPSSTVETPRPASAPRAEEKREAENTAKLAAALPFAQSLPPTFTRTAVPGLGEAAVQKYRGAVYGQFRKADDLVDQARTAHLRGQTVVEFSIDDSGALTGIRVAVSSGQPEVDRIAEDIIRRAAPFPPPPPGAQHVFSPAIRLGLDE